MSKINIYDLKFKRIRKQYRFDDDLFVEVYNPTDEQKKEIINMLIGNMDEQQTININGRDVLLKLVPMLTNIEIDWSNPELIEEVLNEPSDLLLNVIDDITEIVREVLQRFERSLQIFASLPEDVQNEIVEKMNIEQQEREDDIDENKKQDTNTTHVVISNKDIEITPELLDKIIDLAEKFKDRKGNNDAMVY